MTKKERGTYSATLSAEATTNFPEPCPSLKRVLVFRTAKAPLLSVFLVPVDLMTSGEKISTYISRNFSKRKPRQVLIYTKKRGKQGGILSRRSQSRLCWGENWRIAGGSLSPQHAYM